MKNGELISFAGSVTMSKIIGFVNPKYNDPYRKARTSGGSTPLQFVSQSVKQSSDISDMFTNLTLKDKREYYIPPSYSGLPLIPKR